MRILALITARGGSKRIPGKNMRLLGGKPLIAWSIDAAKRVAKICDVLVSTDDSEIADYAKKQGVLVPWLRPAELATDEALSVDVALHALEWYENEKGAVDGLLLLQPTSPFRSLETVDRGIKLFQEHNCRPVIGVSAAKAHPLWCFLVEGDTMRPYIENGDLLLRSQELPPAYMINGALYLIAPKDLRKQRSFYGTNDVVPLIIEEKRESLDIDTLWEWELAEAMLKIDSK